jgi:hypothetical protein
MPRARTLLALGTASACAAVLPAATHAALPANCDQSASKVTCTFSAGSADQTFAVPASIERVDVVAVGAPGGESGPRNDNGPVAGGAGAVAGGTLPVTPGQTLYVQVGGPGDAGFFTGAGGINGGGAGDARTPLGPGGGGGGGASDVRTAPFSAGLSPDPRLLIAGGGGGAGGPVLIGGGLPGYYTGGVGGAAGQPGAPGEAPCFGRGVGGGGLPGTATAAGKGGPGGGPVGCEDGETVGRKGGDGALGNGGSGNTGNGGGGGGGGGGLYGGGQGGQGVFDQNDGLFDGAGGGGGGGSSLVPAGGTVSPNASGLPPSVTISYTITARCLGRRATILAVPGGGLTRGTRGDDVIVGLSSRYADRIRSGRGDDVVCPRGGNDRVRTGAGADRVTAGAGRDRVWTGRGRDSVSGGTQRDRVYCGRGADRVRAVEVGERPRSCEHIRGPAVDSSRR